MFKTLSSSGLVHWDDTEGWDGEGGGRGLRMGTHVRLFFTNYRKEKENTFKTLAQSLQQASMVVFHLS